MTSNQRNDFMRTQNSDIFLDTEIEDNQIMIDGKVSDSIPEGEFHRIEEIDNTTDDFAAEFLDIKNIEGVSTSAADPVIEMYTDNRKSSIML